MGGFMAEVEDGHEVRWYEFYETLEEYFVVYGGKDWLRQRRSALTFAFSLVPFGLLASMFSRRPEYWTASKRFIMPLLVAFYLPSFLFFLICLYTGSIYEEDSLDARHTSMCSVIYHLHHIQRHAIFFTTPGVLLELLRPELRRHSIPVSLYTCAPYLIMMAYSFFFGKNWVTTSVCSSIQIDIVNVYYFMEVAQPLASFVAIVLAYLVIKRERLARNSHAFWFCVAVVLQDALLFVFEIAGETWTFFNESEKSHVTTYARELMTVLMYPGALWRTLYFLFLVPAYREDLIERLMGYMDPAAAAKGAPGAPATAPVPPTSVGDFQKVAVVAASPPQPPNLLI